MSVPVTKPDFEKFSRILSFRPQVIQICTGYSLCHSSDSIQIILLCVSLMSREKVSNCTCVTGFFPASKNSSFQPRNN